MERTALPVQAAGHAPPRARVARAPAPALRWHVERYLALEGHLPHPVRRLELPRGTPTLVIGLGAPVYVFPDGPRTRPLPCPSFLIGPRPAPFFTERRGDRACMDIPLAPWAVRTLFDLDPGDLGECPAPLDDLIGPAATRGLDALRADTAWARRFRHLDRFLIEQLRRNGRARVCPRIRWAWQQLRRTGGRVPVARLARSLGWSHRHFVSRFRAWTGMTPKTAARCLRFARTRRLLAADTRTPLGFIALHCGYSDQSHMSREFRAFAGCSPAAYRAGLTGGDAPATGTAPATQKSRWWRGRPARDDQRNPSTRRNA